jgi:hypothetical protein
MAGPPTLLAVALLWPLFPASMLFNALVDRLRFPPLRALVTLVWPLAGVLLLPESGPAHELAGLPVPLPAWFLPVLALLTALLYAWRSLTVNDLSRWAAMMSTSSLALLWLPWSAGAHPADLAAAAFAFGSACAVLHLVAGALSRRLGSDYLGHGRVVDAHPRLAALLAVSVLAALCAPPFPGFFGMLFVTASVPWWAVAGAGAVWWLWSWSGALLWQRAFFGAAAAGAHGRDVGAATAWLAGLLALLVTFATYAWSTTWMR